MVTSSYDEAKFKFNFTTGAIRVSIGELKTIKTMPFIRMTEALYEFASISIHSLIKTISLSGEKDNATIQEVRKSWLSLEKLYVSSSINIFNVN